MSNDVNCQAIFENKVLKNRDKENQNSCGNGDWIRLQPVGGVKHVFKVQDVQLNLHTSFLSWFVL